MACLIAAEVNEAIVWVVRLRREIEIMKEEGNKEKEGGSWEYRMPKIRY